MKTDFEKLKTTFDEIGQSYKESIHADYKILYFSNGINEISFWFEPDGSYSTYTL